MRRLKNRYEISNIRNSVWDGAAAERDVIVANLFQNGPAQNAGEIKQKAAKIANKRISNMVVMDCYLWSKQHAESVSFAAALCDLCGLLFNFVGASANGDGTRTIIVVRGAEDQFYRSNGARHQRQVVRVT
jgi:hypothetical protein